MTQSRLYNFGDLLTQKRTKAFAARLFLPGLYTGLEPSLVGSSLVRLSPGTYLTPGGVLVTESTPVDVSLPELPGGSAEYTLTAEHTDIQAIGGSAATYAWNEGLLARSGVPDENSLAVLWLRYTGGAVTQSMLSSPPLVTSGAVYGAVEESFGRMQAPFPQMCDVVSGANIVMTPKSHSAGTQHLGLEIRNTAPSLLQQTTFKLPLPTMPRARFIDVYGDLAAMASISAAGVAADGASILMTPSSITGPAVGLDEPVGTFAVGNSEEPVVTLAVTVVAPALTTGVFIKALQVRPD